MPELIKEVICRSCLKPTGIPLPTLERTIRNQGSKDDVPLLNFACPLCNNLTLAGINSQVYAGKWASLPHSFCGIALRCSIESCETPAIVLVPTTGNATLELLIDLSNTWKDAGIICLSGHPPKFPFELVEYLFQN